MQLTLREASTYLGVTEATARRWIGERALPVHTVNERVYLNAGFRDTGDRYHGGRLGPQQVLLLDLFTGW